MKTNTKKSSILIAVLSLTIIASCGKKMNSEVASDQTTPAPAPVQASGGQDGGGGQINYSTEDEVRTAILEAYEKIQVLEPLSQNILREVGMLAAQSDQDIVGKMSQIMLFPRGTPKGVLVAYSRRHLPNLPASYDNIRDYMKLSKLVLKTTEPCVDAHGEARDASVSKNEFGADICFNVESLRKIPADALNSEIMALLLHEVAHINGYGEEDAVLLQKFITENYTELMRGSLKLVKNSVSIAISSATIRLINSCDEFKIGEYHKTHYELGAATSKLESIKDLLGDLEISNRAMLLRNPEVHKEFVSNINKIDPELKEISIKLGQYQSLAIPDLQKRTELIAAYNKVIDLINILHNSYTLLVYGYESNPKPNAMFLEFKCKDD